MKRLFLSFVALALLAGSIAACGQKGPLYLPEDGKDGKASHKSHQYQPKAKPAPTQEQQPELQSEPEQSPAQ